MLTSGFRFWFKKPCGLSENSHNGCWRKLGQRDAESNQGFNISLGLEINKRKAVSFPESGLIVQIHYPVLWDFPTDPIASRSSRISEADPIEVGLESDPWASDGESVMTSSVMSVASSVTSQGDESRDPFGFP